MSGHRRLAVLAVAAAALLLPAAVLETSSTMAADHLAARPAAASVPAARPTRYQLHLLHLHHLRTLHNLHLRHLQTLRLRRRTVLASRTWVRTPLGARVVAAAERYKGQPYSYGNLDCSGLTQRAYRVVDTHLPRSAAQQQRRARHVRTPRPGDLVFYGNPAYHVAIYVRKGWMIAARHTGTVVQEQRIWGTPTFGAVLV